VDWIAVFWTSLPWAALVGLLFYFIKNPEKAEKWSSLIARSFSFLSSRIEKFSVARDIQSDITSFAKKLRCGMDINLIPYGIKVNWVKSTTRQAFVKKGKVVIKMEHHENQAKNFLYALMAWVNRGLIPESRHLLDKSVLQAIDFAFINKALNESKRYDSRQIFLDEIFEPRAPKGSLVERYSSILGRLDQIGLFVGVVLPEYTSLGKRLGSVMPNESIRLETVYFFNMLERLAKRKPGQDINPSYVGEYINCYIVLIARAETYALYGLDPYLGFINKCCREGARSFYVCAIGDPNVSVVKRIRDSYEKSRKLSFEWEKVQSLGRMRSIVLHLATRE
jgi:hypothetical protein